LDLWYRNNKLNPQKWDSIIEEEIIRLAGEEYRNIVLTEYAKYIGKTGGFAASYLWEDIIQKPVNWWNLMKGKYFILNDVTIRILSIPAISAARKRNWSAFGFIYSKLWNKLHENWVEKIIYIY